MRNDIKKLFLTSGLVIVLAFAYSISVGQNIRVDVFECPENLHSVFKNEVYRADKSDGVCNAGTYLHENPQLGSGGELVNSVKVTRLDDGPHRAQVDIDWKDNTQGVLEIKITYKKRIFRGILQGCGWSERYLYTLVIHRKYENPLGTFSGPDVKSAPTSSTPVVFNLQYSPSASFPSALTAKKIRYTNVSGDPVKNGEADIVKSNGVYTATSIIYTATNFGTYQIEADVYTELDNGCGIWLTLPFTKPVTVISSCHMDEFDNVHIRIEPVPEVDQFEEEDVPSFALKENVEYTMSVDGIINFDDHYSWSFDDFGEDVIVDGPSFTPLKKGSYHITVVPDVTLCPVPSEIIAMVGIGEGDRIVIDKECTVTLPMDINDQYDHEGLNDIIFQHFRSIVTTERSIIVNPGITLELGAELILNNPEPAPDPGNDVDLHLNFTEAKTFDEFGRVMGTSRSYFDAGGAFLQSQVKNLTEGVILANTTIYDVYNRAAIQTLPAPVKAAPVIDAECPTDVQVGADVLFEYNANFATVGTDQPYSYLDFDLSTNENDPEPIDDSQEGTLGWYYSSNNITSTNTRTREPLVATTDYPYSRAIFHTDGSGEVKSSTRPGNQFKAGSSQLGEVKNEPVQTNDVYLTTAVTGYLAIRETELGFPAPSSLEGQFFQTVVEDEMNRKGITYTDKSGNVIISVFLGTGTTPTTTSYQYYDNAGRLILSISPNGLNQYTGSNFADIDKTTYEYNSKGFLVAREEKVAGQESDGISRTEFKYAKDGKIRFSQNELQRKAENKQFSYTNYDAVGRPFESGEFTMSGEGNPFTSGQLSAIVNDTSPTGGLPDMDGSRSDQNFTVYDLAQDNIPGGRRQRFVHGAVSSTQKDNDVTTWYSYDERGRVEWIVQSILGLGTKTVDYRYSATGAVQDVVYQQGVEGEQFTHHYEYDRDGRLKKVYTTRELLVYDRFGKLLNDGVSYANDEETIFDPGPLELQATYHYYLHGPLKRVELGDKLQGIDYVYTADGSLKSINRASTSASNDPGGDGETNDFEPDVFGMSLDYYANDYTGANGVTDGAIITGGEAQYSGNIRAMRWHSPIEPTKQFGYVYSYDDRTQFTQADFGTLSSVPLTFTANSLHACQEKIDGYDDNGNILSLARKGSENFLAGDNVNIDLANYEYHYKTNSNILDHITDDTDTVRAYEYDDIGRLTKETIEGQPRYIDYNAASLVAGVYSDEDLLIPITIYTYDDRGFRLSKTTHDSEGVLLTRTWYIRDAQGAMLATYEQNGSDPVKPVEMPVYGANRVGLYKPDFGMTFHEISDHLGNVRAVIGPRLEPPTKTYLATMEDERLAEESDEGFLNVIPAPTASYINHTPTSVVLDGPTVIISDPNEVNRLNNRPNGEARPAPIGAGIVLSVHPGDEIDMEVFAKYTNFDDENSNVLAGLAAFLAQSITSSPLVDAPALFDVVNTTDFTSLPVWAELDEDQPRAFLNYLLFDRNNKLIDFNFVQVSSSAEISISDPMSQSHERLAIEDLRIEKEGLIYIYVSNLSDQNMEVYFDDLKVSHTYSTVVAGGDYYPFGLAINDRQIDRERYRFGYQGQFAEKDEEMGWSHFELREYDPVIGRWMVPDPMRVGASQYNAMGNNPANMTDPDGGCPEGDCPPGFDSKGAYYMMDEVVITPYNALFDTSWTQEAFGGSFQQYQQRFPHFSGMSAAEAYSHWQELHSQDFYSEWNANLKFERGLLAIAKMTWFQYAFTTVGGFTMGMGAIQLPKLPIPNRYNLEYSLRYGDHLSKKLDAYHNFPKAYDRTIIKEGTFSWRIKDRSIWYRLDGRHLGKDGTFEVGIGQEGRGVYHRFFNPRLKL